MSKFVDAHAHVQFAAYDDDRDAVIARAFETGVAIVNVGTNKETSGAAIRLAEKYKEGVYAAVGLHPIHASGSSFHDNLESHLTESESGESFDLDFYKNLGSHPKVVAIGECGLDYFRIENGVLSIEEQKKKQKEVFLKHIELAREVKKPLMIHCRAAFSDLIEILSANFLKLNVVPGVIHFFSGTKDDAKKLINLGFYFTFGGVITFVRDYDEAVKIIPIDRILSETDAPYVTPAPYRGKRNEPSYVIKVVERLAELKNVSVDEMAAQTIKNAQKIFGIDF